jgi:hypothetical protein
MEDSGTLDIPSVSSLLFTSLLCYFFPSLDLGPVQMASAQVLPPPETGQVEVQFPRAPDPPNGYHTVLIGCRTSVFIHLPMLTSYFIVFFLLLYSFMQPRWSAPTGGDNVTARLYITAPRPGNTRFMYSRPATSLRSLAIFLLSLPYTTLHY